MKNLKANYDKHKNKKSSGQLGNYIFLAKAVMGKKFSKETIQKNFNQIMEKDDFDPKDKKDLIKHLYQLSNPSVEAEKGLVNDQY